MTMFGVELEIANGAQALLEALHERKMVPSTNACSYHCGCPDCLPLRTRRYPWAAQDDCTVDGEFISKPLRWGSEEAETALRVMGECLLSSRPHSNYSGVHAGNHVHVSHEGFTHADHVRLHRLFARYEDCTLRKLARSCLPNVRTYNRPLTEWHTFQSLSAEQLRQFWEDKPENLAILPRTDKGPWLSRREPTYEFRLWNSTRAPWRLRMHSAISVAMVEAAKAGVNVNLRTRRTLLQVLRPFLDAETVTSYERQLAA